ncbi:aromatic acid exporter family protein [Streptomyces sp. NPDC058371]|uniref:FUSC family protein n=1 Tax=Streptomyces sp. NPDC058371 TaxID=3346463 RepID=UPI00364F1901
MGRTSRTGTRAVLRALTWEVGAVWGSARRAVTVSGPERTTAVQSLKAAGAALLAWAVAGWWWHAPMALMAPWTALFLVQSTVYRSLLSALQQFVVVVVGTLLAAGAGVLTHNEMAAMALALPLTVLLGNYARFGTHGLYAPTAALFVLAYGSYTGADIAHRLLETLLGAVIGIGVNALVLPPVHDRRVSQLRAQLPEGSGELLHDVADGLAEGHREEQARGWHERAQRLTDVVTDLREARRWSDESYRVNPGHRLRRSAPAPPAVAWDFAWDQVTEHIATTLRTLAEAPRRLELPSDARDALAALLRAAGDACLPDACLPDACRSDACLPDACRPAERSRGAADGVREGSAGRVTSGDLTSGDVAAKDVVTRRMTSGDGRREGATDRRHALAPASTAHRRHALARASAAHRRLTAVCAEHRALMPLVGGLLADTRRLLAALLRIADPEAAFTPPAASARPHAGQPAER